MTDAYWVKPKGQDVRWKDVSFHLNPFREDALDFFTAAPSSDTLHALFTPSASIGGELKKKWIRKDGKIFLVKGNMPGFSFQQSLRGICDPDTRGAGFLQSCHLPSHALS